MYLFSVSYLFFKKHLLLNPIHLKKGVHDVCLLLMKGKRSIQSFMCLIIFCPALCYEDERAVCKGQGNYEWMKRMHSGPKLTWRRHAVYMSGLMDTYIHTQMVKKKTFRHTTRDFAMMFSMSLKSLRSCLVLVLVPSVSSSAWNRKNWDSSLNSLFSRTTAQEVNKQVNKINKEQ